MAVCARGDRAAAFLKPSEIFKTAGGRGCRAAGAGHANRAPARPLLSRTGQVQTAKREAVQPTHIRPYELFGLGLDPPFHEGLNTWYRYISGAPQASKGQQQAVGSVESDGDNNEG